MASENVAIRQAAQASATRILVMSFALFVKRSSGDPDFDAKMRAMFDSSVAKWKTDDPALLDDLRATMTEVGHEMLDQIAKAGPV